MNLGSVRRGLMLLGGATALALLPACSDADPIPASTGSIAFSVQASTAGTGRYETVLFPINTIRLRPVDEFGNAIFAGKQIALTVGLVTGNLAPGASVQSQAAALPPGRYRVEELGISATRLADTTVPLPAPTSCIENLAVIPDTTGAQIPGVSYNASQLTGSQWIFDVTSGSQQLALTVDAPAFVELVESSFTCDDSGGTAVLTSFNGAAYQNGLLPLLAMRR